MKWQKIAKHDLVMKIPVTIFGKKHFIIAYIVHFLDCFNRVRYVAIVDLDICDYHLLRDDIKNLQSAKKICVAAIKKQLKSTTNNLTKIHRRIKVCL